MTGGAAERRRIVVVDLAGQRASAPRIVVHRQGGRGAPAQIWVELERQRIGIRLQPPFGVAQGGLELVERPDHHVRELLLKRRATALLRDEAEQNESEIAVNRSRPRVVLERNAADLVLEFAPACRRRIDQPRRKP